MEKFQGFSLLKDFVCVCTCANVCHTNQELWTLYLHLSRLVYFVCEINCFDVFCCFFFASSYVNKCKKKPET